MLNGTNYHRENLLCILPDPPPGLLTPSGFPPTLDPSLQHRPPMAHMHPPHQPHPPQVGHTPFTGHPYGLCSYSPDFMFYPLQSDQYDQLHTCEIDKLLSVTMYMDVGKFPKSNIVMIV